MPPPLPLLFFLLYLYCLFKNVRGDGLGGVFRGEKKQTSASHSTSTDVREDTGDFQKGHIAGVVL